MKRACVIALVLALPAALRAQAPLEEASAQQLIDLLAAPPAPLSGMSRSMGRRVAAEPDAATHRCTAPGQRADDAAALPRNLVVAAAPKVDLAIGFELDSATIRPASQPLLQALAEAIRSPALDGASFVVAGHTDRRGSDGYNKSLSCERALAVRDYLVRRHGIDGHRLIPLGFGFDRLLDQADPASASNRRVEIRRL